MKYQTSRSYFLAVLVLFIGIIGCSQGKQDKTNTTDDVALAQPKPINVTMYKNPNCKCCSKWATYMEENGFSVTEQPTDTLASVKKQKDVPDKLSACHTAVVRGYIVEGHVPAKAVRELLKKQPNAKGITVPGMPAQSPGMAEEPGPVDVYFFNGPDQVAYFGKIKP
ncbi:hypothetical protein CK503_08600 [Aliifodinibius salipaludis]|uniref:CopG family transcriptional regulator n=1 Tax=Fodinibius salipaludis TaxID=2032627 RepID=A0A2A2GBU0_9BACT|nr:DUF411 domain-containing protein [Aliifodinibius salipaludis]PAU94262.1 hypothetical protein CK503_08600 [Aliifodinibius salipaludis]